MAFLKKDPKEVKNQDIQELDDDLLDSLSGAGNPFANGPYVPPQPIDDDARELP